MNDYFQSFPAHVQGDIDFDAISPADPTRPNLVSLGSDDLIIWRNMSAETTGTKELQIDHGFTKIALHPDGNHFILGGFSKKIYEFELENFENTEPQLMYECLGTIFDLKYSPTGRYISAGTEEQKTIIIDRNTGKKTKCRPGHQNKVIENFFSPNENLIISMGQDCMVLVYQLSADKEPLEVYRAKYCT